MLPVILLLAVIPLDARPLEFAGVTLNHVTLAAVVERFGEATSWHTGDASESEHKVCYIVASGAGRRFIYFTSGELGGGEIVDGVRVALKSDERCTMPARHISDLRAALREYSSRTVVEGRLTSMDFLPDGAGQWLRCFQVELHGQTFENCAAVSAEWRGGDLLGLQLWTTETN